MKVVYRPDSLRSAVLENYVSSSAGVHMRSNPADVGAYVRAYRRYLDGWLPSPNARRRWVDLGCGQGMLMRLAAEEGFVQVEGSDISPEMLQTARRLGLQVKQEDVLETIAGLRSSSCSVISCFDLIEHFPKPVGFEMLCLLKQKLEPGGILLLKLPNGYSPFGFGITANDLTHESVYTAATLIQMGTLAGFKETALREVAPLPHGIFGFCRRTLWRGIREMLKIYDIIETGAPRTTIYTRVMLGRLSS